MNNIIKTIKIKRVTKTAVIPTKATAGSAGFDLYADCDTDIVIAPHETVTVSSGIAFQIPGGYFGAIYARSGLSTKLGVRPANCVAVIDSDFRGAVGLPLHNDSNFIRVISPHERVAQIVFQSADDFNLEVVDRLDATERGVNGFGSSGKF